MAAFLPLAGSALLGGATALLGRQSVKQTQQSQTKQQLIDQLLAGLSGEGDFANLFSMDEDAFQKSYVDPAKQLFSDQIAPQIQQSFLAKGQHKGTGVEDTLSRAGVDLDQILNQQFAKMQQQAQQNKIGAIGQILGSDTGELAPGPTASESFFGGMAQAAATPAFGQQFESATSDFFSGQSRKGFEKTPAPRNPHQLPTTNVNARR